MTVQERDKKAFAYSDSSVLCMNSMWPTQTGSLLHYERSRHLYGCHSSSAEADYVEGEKKKNTAA